MSFILLGILNSQVEAGGGASAYDLLETNILGSNAASVTFSNLSNYSSYTHLQLRISSRTSGDNSNTLAVRFNSDSGTNYANQRANTTGGNVTSSENATSTFSIIQWANANSTNDSNIFGACVVDIYHFASTTKKKTMRGIGGNWQASGFNSAMSLTTSLWDNSNAITSLEIIPVADNFVTDSRFSLYGVK